MNFLLLSKDNDEQRNPIVKTSETTNYKRKFIKEKENKNAMSLIATHYLFNSNVIDSFDTFYSIPPMVDTNKL